MERHLTHTASEPDRLKMLHCGRFLFFQYILRTVLASMCPSPDLSTCIPVFDLRYLQGLSRHSSLKDHHNYIFDKASTRVLDRRPRGVFL